MDIGGQWRIDRVIGNNVLLVTSPVTGKESILLGKGLGYQMKPGGWIAPTDPLIEKRFRMDDREQMRQYEMLETIDPEVIKITEAIIAIMAAEISGNLNENVHTALASHIQFAVYRLRNGMEILNPFLMETKTLFPQEYEVARSAAELISHTFQLKVPEDEIGFLTYHVYSAAQHIPVGQLVKISGLITEMVELVERVKRISIPRDSIDYVRLITHLRFAIDRIKRSATEKNPFVKSLKSKYREEYTIARQMAKLAEEHLKIDVPEDEIGYIVMHLYRLFQHYPSQTVQE
ncbi:BglG family transcription antiterminator [Gorillibacterium massiliense]|uniref:BglG family transcription antiterminator n=1 Tax=Gorillibacterium massiliense TaxID=1280390 RepID=UPI0004B501C0|nr:PRD domain-containing protein [Gorillibacterium massiliense]